jgi:Cu(I)/Ag(I) efflux system membrane fusion protein
MDTSEETKRGLLPRVLFFLKLVEIRLRFVAILVITALVVGYWDTIQNYYERWQRTRRATEIVSAEHPAKGAVEFFCPMHPFVVRDRPGNCPICGMNLVERRKGGAVELPEGVLSRVQVSPERIMQAGVKVEPVAYRLLMRNVRSYATIEPDETRLARIIARFPGRVDDLMVNATGVVVKKNEPLARIYSPKFLSAVQEFLQALASQREAEKSAQASADMKRRAREIADYARRRLALAGFTEEQLDAIAKSQQADEHVTLHSPLGGTVLEKNVLLGQDVDEGTVLYTIADLSTVWIQAQIIESDIDAVKVGMPVEVTAVSKPGEIFYGTVDFIFPTVNLETRSVKVRIVVTNRDGKLKPGMYVTSVIRSPIGRYGEIGTPSEPKREAETSPTVKASGVAATSAPLHRPTKLPTTADADAKAFLSSLPAGAEYYACPMDPEVVSDKPADCPKCGMHLEKKMKAEEAPAVITSETPSTERWAEGYACAMHLDHLERKGGICTVCGCGMPMVKWRIERVLSIPESANIDTGLRQVVYVEATPGVYDAHAVVLGVRAGAYYPVISGLSLGERVVAQGSFLIDAEARLNPTATGGGGAPGGMSGMSAMPGMSGMGAEAATHPHGK